MRDRLEHTGSRSRSLVRKPLPPLGLERARLQDAGYIAALLGIPRKTVLQYARDGRLPCIRLGKHVRFVVADVERAIEGHRRPY